MKYFQLTLGPGPAFGVLLTLECPTVPSSDRLIVAGSRRRIFNDRCKAFDRQHAAQKSGASGQHHRSTGVSVNAVPHNECRNIGLALCKFRPPQTCKFRLALTAGYRIDAIDCCGPGRHLRIGALCRQQHEARMGVRARSSMVGETPAGFVSGQLVRSMSVPVADHPGKNEAKASL